MSNTIFKRINEAIKSGNTAFILSWNTNDRQFCPENEIIPTSLHLALAQYFTNKGYHCGLYSQGLGVQDLIPPNSSQKANVFGNRSNQSFSQLTPILRRNDLKVALIVQYADLLAPTADGSIFLQPEQQVILETLHRWGADDAIKKAQNIVVLISYEAGINSLLTHSGVYKQIEIPLPEKKTRLSFINLLINAEKKDKTKIYAELENGFTPEEMSRISNGLRLNDIESLFRLKTGHCITRKDIQTIKSNTIKEMAGGLVEVMEPEDGFESIAGLESVKEYFGFLKWMFLNGSPAVPYALILSGVPGSGKSKLCSTLAKELNLPLLILRNLHGPFVGQSEANLERVLQVVNSMSPCVIVIEEMDQGIGQRGTGNSGDSGTTNRMSQRFWEALGSGKNRGKNLWIGTSNRPDLLDSAMIDRFQVIIPFIHPTPKEVVQLFPVIAKQLSRELAKDIDLTNISKLPTLYLPTVRGLCEVMSAAAQRADFENRKIGSIINQKHLYKAAIDFKITYDPIQHEYIALKSIEMVSFSSLLPWMSLNGKREHAEIPSYLIEIVDNKTGLIDTQKLCNRIRTLEQEIYTKKMMR